MFEQNQIKAWHSITAPAALKDKVLAEAGLKSSKPKVIPMVRKYAALAACAAIVLTASLVSYSRTAFNVTDINAGMLVTQSGNEQIALARQSIQPLICEFDLDAKRETEISAQAGELRLYDAESGELISSGSALSAKGGAILTWTISEPDNNEAYILRLKSSLRNETITLAFDSESNSWTANIR